MATARRFALGLLASALAISLLGPAPSRAGDDLKPARKRLRHSVAEWALIPKVPIGLKGVFDVYPDGRPTDSHQGRLKLGVFSGVSGAEKAKTCMDQGALYREPLVAFDFEKEAIQIIFYYCAWFKIHYGRPIEARDLDPNAVARALSGFFEIQGPGVGEGVAGLVENALSPIEVGDRQALFQDVVFANPPGWPWEIEGRELYYRQGGKRDIRIRARDLEPAEMRAGPRILLEEELPGRLLRSARNQDQGAKVETVARAYEQAGFALGWADIVYDRTYERHHWVVDETLGRLFTLRAKGQARDRALLAEVMEILVASVKPPSPDLLAAGVTGEASSVSADLPAPTDFGQPALGGRMTMAGFEAVASPSTVRPGDPVEFKMSYSIEGPTIDQVEVIERRTLLFGGRVLPNYPVVESTRLAPGRYETVLPETIPEFAESGVYEIRSELCVEGECQARTSRFEVAR